MENLGYLIAAYLIIWLGLFGYLFWMGGVLQRVRGELAELRARVPAERAPDEPEPFDTVPAARPEANVG